MKSIVVACVSVFGLTLSTAMAEEDPEGKAWRVIESGSNSNIEEATHQVIQDEEAWHAWWQRHNTNVEVIDGKESAPKPPDVDFSKETVLTATLGMRSSGGYSIEFTKIHHEGDTMIASYKISSPGPGDMVTMALTAPFTIIAAPKHESPIRFVEEKKPQ